jgi:hypothetical protein
MHIKIIKDPIIISNADLLFCVNKCLKLLVFERLVIIKKIFPIIKLVNAIALTSPSVWPSLIEIK